MILTDAHFENIQSVIRKELLMAKRTVYAAIAWFTDDILFNTLIEVQKKDVQVHLCIIEDEINIKPFGLPFAKLNNDKGKYFAITSDKMHHKFCVIDENVVITGSYNWTYKAANAGKDENIIVTRGDLKLADKFINEFFKITKQETNHSTINSLNLNDNIISSYTYDEVIAMGSKQGLTISVARYPKVDSQGLLYAVAKTSSGLKEMIYLSASLSLEIFSKLSIEYKKIVDDTDEIKYIVVGLNGKVLRRRQKEVNVVLKKFLFSKYKHAFHVLEADNGQYTIIDFLNKYIKSKNY